MVVLGENYKKPRWPVTLAFTLVLALGREVRAEQNATPISQKPQMAEEVQQDYFEFSGKAALNLRFFERALLPGPSGSIVSQNFQAPVHQSVSARAVGIDSPMGKDSLEVQIAAYGQLNFGADDSVQKSTWDVASAFLKQRWKRASLAVGRQSVAGGAARYTRFDGGHLEMGTDFGLSIGAYGGLTALPRWDQQYGYHHLGDAYEEWNAPSNAPRTNSSERLDQWTAGARLKWADPELGGVSLGIHQQGETGGLYRSTLGLGGFISVIPRLSLDADALFATEPGEFSDVRIGAELDAWDSPHGGLRVRGEYLHTVPSLLLSQSSVFSVFSYSQITEAGGNADLGLPYGISVEASGYAQMRNEGSLGLRTHLGARLRHGERHPLLVRLVAERLMNQENGYWMLRSSVSYRFIDSLSLLADAYHYRYDQLINEFRSSSFYAAHLSYQADEKWSARVGGSMAQSPYARMDVQAIARLMYEFDRAVR